ncbi:MAG: DUF1330 domain-containing protein [Thiohalocapsa sp.]
MHQAAKTIATLLAGFAPGAGAIQGLHAQGQKKPAYVIAEVQVTDAGTFQQYASKVPETLQPYHGRYIVRAATPEAIEGDSPKGRVAVLAFDSLDDAKKWHDSPAYAAIVPIRHRSATTRAYFVEGVPQ